MCARRFSAAVVVVGADGAQRLSGDAHNGEDDGHAMSAAAARYAVGDDRCRKIDGKRLAVAPRSTGDVGGVGMWVSRVA
jgi:hypothetical protein